MDKNKNKPIAYKVGTTLYQVKSVFSNSSTSEDIATKIERLILKDSEKKM